MFSIERMEAKWPFGPAVKLWHRVPTCTISANTLLFGCYTLMIDGERVPLRAGEEYFIPKGKLHGGEVVAGTRTIHAFGGCRALRAK